MANWTDPLVDDFEAEKVDRFRRLKRNAPLALLLLAFVFMLVAILVNSLWSIEGMGGLIPLALTALLGTLAAAWKTMIGRTARKIEKYIQSVAANASSSRKELLGISQASLKAQEQTISEISCLEDNQRRLLEKLAELKKTVETRHDVLHKSTQGQSQVLAKGIDDLVSGNEAMQTRIDALLMAGQLMSDRIHATVGNQRFLHGAVQEHRALLDDRMSNLEAEQQQLRGHADTLQELLQAVAGDVTDVAREQVTLHEVVDARSKDSIRHLDTLLRDHISVQNQVTKLGETVKHVSAEAVALLTKRVSSRECLQSQTEALDAQLSGLATAQEQLGGHVDGLRELMQAVAGDLTHVVREQVTLHQAVENRGRESAQQMEALSQDNRTAQTHVEELGETVKRVSAETLESLAQRGTSRESFQAHTEAMDAQLSGLSNAQEQLRGHVNGLKELMQAVAGEVTQVAHEQGTLHEAIETRGEESTQRLDTLSENHVHVHNHLDHLGENIKQIHAETAERVTERVTERVASRESFQAHTETLDAQLSGLSNAQEQLRGHVNGLKELMQAVAGEVTQVAHEQATLHEAIETRGEESTQRLDTLSEDHTSVHNHLDHLDENARKISDEALEKIIQYVTSREVFQAHTEALDAQMSGLSDVQEQLCGYMTHMRELLQTVSSDVTHVAHEQDTLHKAIEIKGDESAQRLESLSEDHTHVHSHLDQLGQNVKQASIKAAERVAQQVASRESFQTLAEALDTQLSGLGTAQERLRGHIFGLREIMQAVAGDLTHVAREQTTLHEVVDSRGKESVRRLETLSEDQRAVHNHLDHLGEKVKQAHTETRDAQRSGLTHAQKQLHGHVDGLGEIMQAVAGDVTHVARGQATLREDSARRLGTLADDHVNIHNHLDHLGEQVKQAHAETLDTKLSGIAHVQEQLRGHVDGLGAIMEAVAREQATLQETVETRSEESVRRLDSLSEDHVNAHHHLDHLGEQVKQAYAEMLDAKLSGIAQAQEQLRGHVDGLGAIMQAVAHEQTTLHETVETRGQESARHLETLSADHENVHNHLNHLGEDVKQAHAEMLDARLSGIAHVQEQLRGHMEGLGDIMQAVVHEQASLHGTVEAHDEESARHLEALSEDHHNVHQHLTHLDETVKQASTEAAEHVIQQVASRESLQGHSAALDAKLSGLAQAQEQLRGHVDGLGEIMQAVAHDQAILHEAVATHDEQSARHLETLSVDHQNVHHHLDHLGEQVEQTGTETAEQVAESVTQKVASRESLQAHTAALDAKLSGLAQSQEQLHGHVDGLGEIMQTVAGDVTDVTCKQTTLHEAIETRGDESARHLETLSEDHRNVHQHLDHLGETVEQAGVQAAEQVAESVTQKVASRESLQAHTAALDAKLSGLAQSQEQLHEAIETRGDESAHHFETLAEDHRNVHNHLGHLSETVEQTGAQAAKRVAENVTQKVASHESLQAHTAALEAKLSGLAQSQEQLHEAIETRGDESARHLETLSEDHRNVHNHLDHLGETVEQAGAQAAEQVAESVTQKVASRESLQAHTAALDAKLSGLAQSQEQLHGHVDGLGDIMQTVADDVTNVTHNQTTLHETLETRGEESTHHFETLAEDHRNVHHHLDHLDEKVRQASAQAAEQVTEQVTQQVANHESIQAHAAALDAKLSGLAQAQEQLRGHVDGLGDIMQTVAGDVTNVTRGQAALHEAMETGSEESVRRLETFTEDHRNVHNHLDYLGEKVEQASIEAAKIVAQRIPSRESFEALDAQMTELAAAQEQLRNHVDGLRKLIQVAAGEQALLSQGVETPDEDSARRLETLSEEQMDVHHHLDRLTEKVKEASAETTS